VASPESAPPPIPEEAIAQDYQLRLSFGAKTSVGVRFKGGPQMVSALPRMIEDLAESDIEVVPARETTLTIASPSIVRAREAGEWLRAHGENSPITRHALFVLESLDAIDPAYDTFAVTMLDGEIDTSGYPEYASIVGGVAAHWDESTGDLIVRGVVGWGGRGARGDTDRNAAKILSRILGNILASGESLGLAAIERPMSGGASVACPHCGFPLASERAVYCPKCGMKMRG
jgi:hypothetical protein